MKNKVHFKNRRNEKILSGNGTGIVKIGVKPDDLFHSACRIVSNRIIFSRKTQEENM